MLHGLLTIHLGGKDENLDFEMGPNTSVYYSCAAKLNGEMFVFGGTGSDYNKQVPYFYCNLFQHSQH